MTEQPTTEQPYTGSDVQLVAAALHSVHCLVPHDRADDEDEDHARAALDALAAAGRLLPEGASHERHVVVETIANNGRTDRQMAVDLDHAQRVAAILQRHWPEVSIYTWHTWTTKPERVQPVPINEESTDG